VRWPATSTSGQAAPDKAYDHRRCRRACRRRQIKPRIARRGIEVGQKLGRHSWVTTAVET